MQKILHAAKLTNCQWKLQKAIYVFKKNFHK